MIHKAKIALLFLLLPLSIVAYYHYRPQRTAVDPDRLRTYISRLEKELAAEIAVSFYDFDTGQYFGYSDSTLMHAASTMKVPVMIEVFRQAEKGRFSLRDSVLVKNQFKSIVDGSPYSLFVSEDGDSVLYALLGKRTTIGHLVEQMIIYSSNLATNLLIERVGAREVTATMRELGAPWIQVRRGVEDLKAYEQGLNNETTAYDLMVILRALVENRAASPESCRQMINILKRQHFRHKIPAGLPDGWEVGNKTGSISGISHDSAIVFPPDRPPYILVVLTRGIADHEVAASAIANISRTIRESLSASTTGS